MRRLVLATVLLLVGAADGLAFSTRSVRFFGNQLVTTTDDAIRLDVDAPEQPADVGTADFTIEQWLRCLDQTPIVSAFRAADTEVTGFDWIAGNIFLDRDIVGTPPSGGDWGASIHRAGSAAGPSVVRFGAEDASGTQLTIQGGVDVCDGTWHHVAVGRDTSNRLFLVVDGVLDYRSSGAVTGDLSYPDGLGSVTDRQLVWAAEKHAFQAGYAGHLDEIRVWSDARTVSEIADNRFVALAGDEPNLELYLRLEEGDRGGTPETLTDATGGTTATIFLYDGSAGNGEWSTENPAGTPPSTTTTSTSTSSTTSSSSTTTSSTTSSSTSSSLAPTTTSSISTSTTTSSSSTTTSSPSTTTSSAISSSTSSSSTTSTAAPPASTSSSVTTSTTPGATSSTTSTTSSTTPSSATSTTSSTSTSSSTAPSGSSTTTSVTSSTTSTLPGLSTSTTATTSTTSTTSAGTGSSTTSTRPAVATSTTSTTPLPLPPTTTTTRPECLQDADCDDTNPCTEDRCVAGACSRAGPRGLPGAMCTLDVLVSASLCPSETLAPRAERRIRRELRRARRRLSRAIRAGDERPRRAMRHVRAAGKALRKAERRVMKVRRIADACRDDLEAHIAALREVLSADRLRARPTP